MSTTQRDHEVAALLGGLTGAIPAARNYFRSLERDADRNILYAKETKADAKNALAEVKALLRRGDLLRGLYPSVQDFEAGLASASHYRKSPGGVLVPNQACCDRPDPVSEDEIEDLKFPVRTSVYDGDMLIENQHPVGTLFDVGQALTLAEAQTMLLSLQQEVKPTGPQLVQAYRAFHALFAIAMDRGYTTTQFKAAWRAVLPDVVLSPGASIPRPGSLIDIVQAVSSAITNTTTETAFDRTLTIPANLVPIGRSVRVRFGFRIPSGNSTDTLLLKARLASASGQVLVTGSAVDVGNSGDYGFIDFSLVRRPDSTVSRGVVSGLVGAGSTFTASGLVETSIDFTAALVIVATATWSVASASNQVVMDNGIAVLE